MTRGSARVRIGYKLTIVYEDGSETKLQFGRYSAAVNYLAFDVIPEMVTASIETLYSEPGVPIKIEVKQNGQAN